MPEMTQAAAIARLEEGAERLAGLLAGVPDRDLERGSTIGDGSWSAKDLIGHVATWEEFALAAIAERQGGAPWAIGQRLGTDGQVDAANDEAVREWSALSLVQTRARASLAHAEIVRRIGGLDDELWFGSAGVAPTLGDRLGGLLGTQGRPFGHVEAHLPDLEAFVSSLE